MGKGLARMGLPASRKQAYWLYTPEREKLLWDSVGPVALPVGREGGLLGEYLFNSCQQLLFGVSFF